MTSPDVDRWCPACRTTTPDRYCPDCGGATTTAITASDDSARPDTKTVVGSDSGSGSGAAGDRWWTRRRITTAAIAVAITVTSVVGWLWWQTTGNRDADGPVAAYFAALESGDGPAARALLADAGVDADSPLWAEGALESGYQAPESVQITDTDYGGADRVDQRPNMDYASVTVTYVVAGEPVDQSFHLWREQTGANREWSIVEAQVGHLNVADGTTIAGTDALDADVITAPPGVYDATTPGNALYTDASGEVPVIPSATGDADLVQLDRTIRADAVEQVDALIRTRIDDCAAAATLDWDTCPWSLGDSAKRLQTTDADWTITRYPDIDIDTNGDVQVTTPGEATAVYTVIDGTHRTATAALQPLGTVGIDTDGNLTWTYTPPG